MLELLCMMKLFVVLVRSLVFLFADYASPLLDCWRQPLCSSGVTGVGRLNCCNATAVLVAVVPSIDQAISAKVAEISAFADRWRFTGEIVRTITAWFCSPELKWNYGNRSIIFATNEVIQAVPTRITTIKKGLRSRPIY